MKKLVVLILFVACSCAGSVYEVRQTELMKRGMKQPNSALLYGHKKK